MNSLNNTILNEQNVTHNYSAISPVLNERAVPQYLLF